MTIKEETRDLFTVPHGYYLAHCISADFALGAGIALQFDANYNMRKKLNQFYDNAPAEFVKGECKLIDNVFNLVTKAYGYDRPTYTSLYEALLNMKEYINLLMIDKIAMPRIGCGLDGLDYVVVYDMIVDVFEDTDIEILICAL